jgi:hypothetical protein
MKLIADSGRCAWLVLFALILDEEQAGKFCGALLETTLRTNPIGSFYHRDERRFVEAEC